MDGQGSMRRSLSTRSLSERKKNKPSERGSFDAGRSPSSSLSLTLSSERTVKRLRLSKAITMPENMTVHEACRRMAARRVDAVLLTDSNALLCGILTDKDISTRVIARELKLEDTPVSKVMTRNPVFVLSDTLAVEALQKMVQGKFRHLPVVENSEVIALLDIAKCLYDAIARMERAAEKGKAIAAAVEGVEKHWGTSISGPNTFIETLRERMFRPSLSTVISGYSKVATVLPTDSVLCATKKMLEVQISSAVVIVGNKPEGILTSRDILMRVIAKDLPPDSISVEKKKLARTNLQMKLPAKKRRYRSSGNRKRRGRKGEEKRKGKGREGLNLLSAATPNCNRNKNNETRNARGTEGEKRKGRGTEGEEKRKGKRRAGRGSPKVRNRRASPDFVTRARGEEERDRWMPDSSHEHEGRKKGINGCRTRHTSTGLFLFSRPLFFSIANPKAAQESWLGGYLNLY